MPLIIKSDEMKPPQEGPGWRLQTLADSQAFGVSAMTAKNWVLEPNTVGPHITDVEPEQMLYVIRGSGVAIVGDERLPLEPESMLWIEPDDEYHLEAGPNGLEILQANAPGE